MSHTTLTSGSTGSGYWWERLGKIEAFVLDLQSFLGGATTSGVGSGVQIPTRLSSLVTLLTEGTADVPVLAAVQQALASFQSDPQGLLGTLQAQVQQLLVDMADLDSPLPSLDATSAFTALCADMLADSATISHGSLPAVGAQTNAFSSPVGNPTFVWSAVDSAGRGLNYVFPETAKAVITQDSQNGATKGSEPFTVTGQNAQTNFLSWDWLTASYGSGGSLTGNLADPTVDNTSSTAAAGTNMLVNGAIKVTTTANVPDNWAILTGTAGSTITATAGSGGYITGSGVLTMASDGATDLAVTQAFNTASSTTVGAGGTPCALVPSAVNNTQYAVFVPYKLSVASPAAGNLRIELIDGGGSTIADDAGTNNQINVDLTAVADTNWHVATGTFRLPKSLPSSTPYKLKIWQSTAVTSGKNVLVSCPAMTPAQQFYAGGPCAAAFRGSTDVNASGVQADAWTFGITNTPGKLEKCVWRFFNPPSLGPQTPGLQVPHASSGSATVPDSLVA